MHINKLNSQIILFYIINFLSSCIFSIPIFYFFFVSFIWFSISQALFLITFFWVISTFFEVPTWVLADKYGRKITYILWLIFSILWFSIYLIFDSFSYFVISWILLWIGSSMNSWTYEWIIHDYLEKENKLDIYDHIQSNQYISIFIWRWFAFLFSWYLFTMSEFYPYIATIICYTIAAILSLFILNINQLKSELTSLSHIKECFLFITKHKNIFFIMIFLWFLFTGLWNVYRFTYQPYLESYNFSIEFIWVVYFILSIFSAIWAYIIKKIINKYNYKYIMLFMFICLFIVSLLFFILKWYFVVLPIFLLSILFWFVMVFWNTTVLKLSPKTHKSTNLSIFSFFCSIGYFLFTSISWIIIEVLGLLFLYNILIVFIFIVTLIIYYFYILKEK